MNDRMLIDRLARTLEEAAILPGLAEILPDVEECWLVGGALRDLILGRSPLDLDIATSTDPTPLAKAFARKRNWTWFPLDELRRHSRAVGTVEGKKLTIDFTPLRAPDLESDLRLRDYTCNALALPLNRGGIGDLSDPLEGRRDIRSRTLRACSGTVLKDDPLRILKGVRHAVELAFDIEPATAELMRSSAPLIRNISPERIRSELFRILSSERVLGGLKLINDFKLFKALFSDHAPATLSENRKKIALLIEMERRLRAEAETDDFDRILEEGLTACALPRLYCFLRSGSPASPSLSGKRFRLSLRTMRGLRSLELLDEEPRCVPPSPLASDRGHALWLSRYGGEPAATALHLASFKGVDVSLVVRALHALDRHGKEGKIPDLIDGNRLAELFDIAPGPVIGELQNALRLAETRGEVKTPPEGEAYLRKWLKRG